MRTTDGDNGKLFPTNLLCMHMRKFGILSMPMEFLKVSFTCRKSRLSPELFTNVGNYYEHSAAVKREIKLSVNHLPRVSVRRNNPNKKSLQDDVHNAGGRNLRINGGIMV